MTSRLRLLAAAASIAIVGASACSSATKFGSTWHDPTAGAITLRGQRVVALVITRNEATRRVAEDVLASELTARGATGIAAYTVLPATAYEDTARARAAFATADIEGVVSLRFLSSRERTVVVPNSPPLDPYRSFWRYYPYGWSTPMTRIEEVTRLETLVYSLKQDKLLWAGTSETVDAGITAETVRDVAKQVAKRLHDDGLIE
jgi:hypothetical protein